MKQFILNVQFISLCVGALCLLFLLGAEPGTSEESMYDYEHFCDKGNFGWYLLWTFGISVVLFITTTIIRFRMAINGK